MGVASRDHLADVVAVGTIETGTTSAVAPHQGGLIVLELVGSLGWPVVEVVGGGGVLVGLDSAPKLACSYTIREHIASTVALTWGDARNIFVCASCSVDDAGEVDDLALPWFEGWAVAFGEQCDRCGVEQAGVDDAVVHGSHQASRQKAIAAAKQVSVMRASRLMLRPRAPAGCGRRSTSSRAG